MPAARRHRALNPLEQRGFRHRARGSGNLLALLDKDEAGYALNTKADGQRLLQFCVDLAEAQVRFDQGCDRREARRHLAARPTPRRPEIDQKRNVARCGMLFKIR